jgi:RNA polymerase subunit RPABC4/transcription elongation factor Spt4
MTLDPSTLSNIILTGSAVAAAFLTVLWVSLVVWTYRDIRGRTRDRVMHFLAMLLVISSSLPGVVIYLVLRPRTTFEEEYQRNIEEEALLQSIEEASLCHACGRRVKEDWIVCPSCHTNLKKTCSHCNKPLELSWSICPYCATTIPGGVDEGSTTPNPNAPENF